MSSFVFGRWNVLLMICLVNYSRSQKTSLVAGCTEFKINDSAELSAFCKNANKDGRYFTFGLFPIIGNLNGKLSWNSSDFDFTCVNCAIDARAYLQCDCEDIDQVNRRTEIKITKLQIK